MPVPPFTTATDPMVVVQAFLTATLGNLIYKDDNAAFCTWLVYVNEGDIETVAELFTSYDVLFKIEKDATLWKRFVDGVPVKGEYRMTITISTMDKTGITGAITLHKAERAMKYLIINNSDLGSGRHVGIYERSRVVMEKVAGKALWSVTYTVNYEDDVL